MDNGWYKMSKCRGFFLFCVFICALSFKADILLSHTMIALNWLTVLIDFFSFWRLTSDKKRTAKTQIDGENVKRRWKCKKIAKKHKKLSINYKRCAKWDLNESYRWWNSTRNELQRLINWSVSILHVYFGSSFWNHQTY